MALETRGNNSYFYKKERWGNRVVSIYSGGGYLAQCFHILNQTEREGAAFNSERTKREFEIEKNNQNEIDQLIESVCKTAKAFEDALFLINGYHLYERQWRKKRQ